MLCENMLSKKNSMCFFPVLNIHEHGQVHDFDDTSIIFEQVAKIF